MPMEVKKIFFTEKEVRNALVNFAVLNKEFLDVDDVEKIIIDEADSVRVSMLVDKTLGKENNELSFSSAQVGAALMAFCMVSKIPLPKKGNKALEADNNKICLKITLDQQVDFQDYTISSRISNSYNKRI
mgnify:CR=1 FL=1